MLGGCEGTSGSNGADGADGQPGQTISFQGFSIQGLVVDGNSVPISGATVQIGTGGTA